MKYFNFDLETTGVKHWKNGIHQIGYEIRSGDGSLLRENQIDIKPYHRCIIVPEALEVSDKTEADLETHTEFRDGYLELLDDLDEFVDKFDREDKFFQLGYNIASFDSPFLRNFFKQNGNKYFGSYFWADVLDVRVLAAQHLRLDRPNLPNFRLSTVAGYVGVSVDKERLHEAKYDLELTWKIYKAVT